MKREYLKLCAKLSRAERALTNSNQKIIRHFLWQPPATLLADDLLLSDIGYTAAKTRRLDSLYLVPESIQAAKQLWVRRVEKNKYGSVGATTYGHYIKAERPSLGPCLQAVVFTRHRVNRVWQTDADIYYRSTELFKKFPADLIWLRDTFFREFGDRPTGLNFFFTNITVHPLYIVVYLALLGDPIAELEDIREFDDDFHENVLKQLVRYEKYHINFSQMENAFAGAIEVMGKKKFDEIVRYARGRLKT